MCEVQIDAVKLMKTTNNDRCTWIFLVISTVNGSNFHLNEILTKLTFRPVSLVRVIWPLWTPLIENFRVSLTSQPEDPMVSSETNLLGSGTRFSKVTVTTGPVSLTGQLPDLAFLSSSYNTANDMLLIPIEKLFSNRDSIRKAREAFLIQKGRTIDPDGLNIRGEKLYFYANPPFCFIMQIWLLVTWAYTLYFLIYKCIKSKHIKTPFMCGKYYVHNYKRVYKVCSYYADCFIARVFVSSE